VKRFTLNVKKRDVLTNGELRQNRLAGNIPGVLYGKKQKPVSLFVNGKELEKVTSSQAGFNALLDLNFEQGEQVISIIRDYQVHPLKRAFSHVDFQAIDPTEKMHLEVPIKLIGEPIGVKEGGVLEQLLRKVEVKCLPTNVPESFIIDVASLQVGGSVHVKNIELPEGVEFLKELDYAVATVVPPAKEEEVQPVVAEGEVPAGEVPSDQKTADQGATKKEDGAAKKEDGAAKKEASAPKKDAGAAKEKK